MIFWRLRTEPGEKGMFDEEFNYFSLRLSGYHLMYAKSRWRPDGRRLYGVSPKPQWVC